MQLKPYKHQNYSADYAHFSFINCVNFAFLYIYLLKMASGIGTVW